MAAIVKRAILGVTINGDEYLLNEDGYVMVFASKEDAAGYLKAHGVCDVEVERSLNGDGPFTIEESIGTCPRCGGPLFASDIDGYDYQCFDCDEDFYECEVRKENEDGKRND